MRDEEDYANLPTFLRSVKLFSRNLPDNHLVCFFVRFSHFCICFVVFVICVVGEIFMQEKQIMYIVLRRSVSKYSSDVNQSIASTVSGVNIVSIVTDCK